MRDGLERIWKQEVLGGSNRLLSLIRQGPHWKRTEPLPSNNKGILPEPLSSHNKGILPEPLPSNDRGYTYRRTDWWERCFNYAVEMGLGAVIYVPSFIKIEEYHLLGYDAVWSVELQPTFRFRLATCLLAGSCWIIPSTTKIEAIYSSETTVDFQRTVAPYITGNRSIHNHRYENLKSYNHV
jgi:hypothetical protein